MQHAFLLYIAIVLSLIWGRFRFFRMDAGTGNLTSFVYDFAVGVQILATLYYMVAAPLPSTSLIAFCCLLYFVSLAGFWWAVVTAKQLDFAFSDKSSSLVTTGPFGLVRHPFYTSYILTWIASTLLFNSLVLWITLCYLVAFYFMSARKEERVMLGGQYSMEYQIYIQCAGMFLPRIRKTWNR